MHVPAFLRNETKDLDQPAILAPANEEEALESMEKQLTAVETVNSLPVVAATYRTAATKGAVDNSVSAQWANRPDDERYLDLYAMRDSVEERFKNCRTIDLRTDEFQINDNMQLEFDKLGAIDFSNWTFAQLCRLITVPQEYMKRLPAKLASECMRHSIAQCASEPMKALVNVHNHELRAINAATYGRIWDYQVINEVIKIAGNGVDETIWKVPGQIDWSDNNGTTVKYNPFVDVTKETTTLYASDRDMYIFLVDDTHPIEIGKLPNGEPDLLFRGFYVWNSECGASSFGVSTMLMRGVCANRNIWGVEQKRDFRLKHSQNAFEKFYDKTFPMLAAYALSPTVRVIEKVRNAKQAIIARDDEERLTFLMGKMGFTTPVAEKVMERHMLEEQRPIESIWDAVQGITAYSRTVKHQDLRVDLESKAGKLMEKVNA